MNLPSRLRSTTIADLLDALWRANARGMLELVEDDGRSHRIYVDWGSVVGVQFDGASPSLAELLRRGRAVDEDVLRRSVLRSLLSQRLHGEVLVEEFRVSRAAVDAALRKQTFVRLRAIDALADARLVFHVAVRPPRWALRHCIDPADLPRSRGRPDERFDTTLSAPQSVPDRDAWRVLGVSPGTDLAGIKRAYRHLARSIHPDLHPCATDEQRRALEARFVQITDAYRALVA